MRRRADTFGEAARRRSSRVVCFDDGVRSGRYDPVFAGRGGNVRARLVKAAAKLSKLVAGREVLVYSPTSALNDLGGSYLFREGTLPAGATLVRGGQLPRLSELGETFLLIVVEHLCVRGVRDLVAQRPTCMIALTERTRALLREPTEACFAVDPAGLGVVTGPMLAMLLGSTSATPSDQEGRDVLDAASHYATLFLEDIDRRTRQHVASGEAGGAASIATAPGEELGAHPRKRPGPNGEAVGTLTMPCRERGNLTGYRARGEPSKRSKRACRPAEASEIAVRFVACPAKKVQQATLTRCSNAQGQEVLTLPVHRCDSADCPVSRVGFWQRRLKDIQARMDSDGENFWIVNHVSKDSPRENLVSART